MAYDVQEDHDAVFAGSDDGFVAMFDADLNFEKDWRAQEHGVNSVCVGADENETSWLYTCSAFGEMKQWWPAAVELIYQNTTWHPGSESKVRGLHLIHEILYENISGLHLGWRKQRF